MDVRLDIFQPQVFVDLLDRRGGDCGFRRAAAGCCAQDEYREEPGCESALPPFAKSAKDGADTAEEQMLLPAVTAWGTRILVVGTE